jgi:hypothetical protein
MILLVSFGCKIVGDRHKLVDNDESDTETRTKHKYLLTNGVAECIGTSGFLVKELGHRRISENFTRASNNVLIHVSNEIGWEI